MLDALIIAPCTGNTISKIANGSTDSCVSMAAKATLRNKCPVIIAMSTNELVIIRISKGRVNSSVNIYTQLF